MRIYTIPFANVTVGAVQDLISAQSTSGGSFWLNELYLGQTGITSPAMVRLSVKRFSGAYTIGSGGNAVTPGKALFGDAAPTVTGRINDTTQTVVGGGAVQVLVDDVANLVNGWQYWPAADDRFKFNPSQAMVWSLDTAPASTPMSGYAVIAEDF